MTITFTVMNFFRKIFLMSCVGFLAITACKEKSVTPTEDLNNVDCSGISSGYASNVKPIIDANCLSSGCHNSGSTNGDLSTYAGVKAKVDNGSISNRVIVLKNMPVGSSLSMDQLKKIKCWLNSGAPNN